MGRIKGERLAILVVDDQGELLSHARSEFLGDRVVRVCTARLARRALSQVGFDIILCRQGDAHKMGNDDRITVVDRPLTPQQVLDVIAAALWHRERRRRRPKVPLPILI